MKVFSIIGISKSGKTTVAERMIEKLSNRRYTVGSVKEIHYEKFTMETEGSNTDRHHKAGAEPVTARGFYETNIRYSEKKDIKEILKYYDNDWVVLEGVTDLICPIIITAYDIKDLEEKWTEHVFAISGKIAEKYTSYRGVPVINVLKEPEKLVNLIEKKVYEVLPNIDEKCCGKCGLSCNTMGIAILNDEKNRRDCVLYKDNYVEICIGDNKIHTVPFVEEMVKNTLEGVLKALDGFKEGEEINVTIRKKN
jgi:molybdopterin-guanine dinucleotide biosynthesis protein B